MDTQETMVEFRAGKMISEGTRVVPDTRKGLFRIAKGEEGLMHFQWLDRSNSNRVEDITGVGLNTEWGLMMASISEDTGEETPLQVRLNGVATFIGIVGLTVALVVLIVLLASHRRRHNSEGDV